MDTHHPIQLIEQVDTLLADIVDNCTVVQATVHSTASQYTNSVSYLEDLNSQSELQTHQLIKNTLLGIILTVADITRTLDLVELG